MCFICQPWSISSTASQSSSGWLRGCGRSQAEVEHVVDQRRAEMPQPDVIDRHARRERILAVGDPFGESQPAAGALVRQLFAERLDTLRSARPARRARLASAVAASATFFSRCRDRLRRRRVARLQRCFRGRQFLLAGDLLLLRLAQVPARARLCRPRVRVAP